MTEIINKLKKIIGEVESYSIRLETLTNNIDLAQYMVGKMAFEDDAPEDETILKQVCWTESLLVSISELIHKRNNECDNIITELYSLKHLIERS